MKLKRQAKDRVTKREMRSRFPIPDEHKKKDNIKKSLRME
jgi:hypothetical protein